MGDDEPDPDWLRRIVMDRLYELRLGAVEAARGHVERNFISDIINGRKRSVRGDNLRKLARALRLDPGKLAQGIAVPAAEEKANAGGDRRAETASAVVLQDVPVRGAAAGALADTFKVAADTVEHVWRPPALRGVRGLYAIYVVRSSMEPEHRAGELRFVHPHRPVKIGDSVVVKARWRETGEVESYIATFVGRTKTKVILRKHNPPAKVEIEGRFVESMEKVLTVNELFGM